MSRVVVFPDDHEQREELHVGADEEGGTDGRRGWEEWWSGSACGGRRRRRRERGCEGWRRLRGCIGGSDGGRRIGKGPSRGRKRDGSGGSLHGEGVTHDPFGG